MLEASHLNSAQDQVRRTTWQHSIVMCEAKFCAACHAMPFSIEKQGQEQLSIPPVLQEDSRLSSSDKQDCNHCT